MQAYESRDSTHATSNQPAYSTLVARVSGAGKVDSVEQAIKKLGFNTFSILDATKSMRRFFAILDIFLGIFGSLALTVASIGIINTLVMAILERRREIGIMKAVGASDGDVRGLFYTSSGAVYGAAFIVALPAGLQQLSTNVHGSLGFVQANLPAIQQVIFGLTIMLFLVFEPKGLARIWQRAKDYFRLWPFRY